MFYTYVKCVICMQCIIYMYLNCFENSWFIGLTLENSRNHCCMVRLNGVAVIILMKIPLVA